jgi:uncharacterized membrane protein YgcG
MKIAWKLFWLALIWLYVALPIARADERILAFDSLITVNADASLLVQERIRARAEGREIKHGIYRDFPHVYRASWGLYQRAGFHVDTVSRDGQPENFETAPQDNGTRVYIGRSDSLIPAGEYTYELTYRADRQLGFFDTHDELYWNVTGNGWRFPIDAITATVNLPPNVAVRKTIAYTGAQGARGNAYKSEALGNQATFRTTESLDPGNGLTIVVQWPKGGVVAPSDRQKWRWRIEDNIGILLGLGGLLLVLIYYGITWNAVGRDPEPGVIIPRHTPPKGFSPAAVRFLYRMGYDDTCFAVALIDLAAKGIVTIGKHDQRYKITRQNNAHAEATPDEKAFADALFGKSSEISLIRTNRNEVLNARKALLDFLTRTIEEVYFLRNLWLWCIGLALSFVAVAVSLFMSPDTAFGKFNSLFLLICLSIWTLAVTYMVSTCVGHWKSRQWRGVALMSLFALPSIGAEIAVFVLLAIKVSIWVVGIYALAAFINGLFCYLLRAPTRAGRQILDQIEGFKFYLSVAEKDRLNLENPPDQTPKLFETFLPYALALGVEQAWSEQFTEVLAQAMRDDGSNNGYSPSWARGTDRDQGAGVGEAVGSLGSSLSSAISSASISSGGGGEGSSGGGSGGGGGGGW